VKQNKFCHECGGVLDDLFLFCFCIFKYLDEYQALSINFERRPSPKNYMGKILKVIMQTASRIPLSTMCRPIYFTDRFII